MIYSFKKTENSFLPWIMTTGQAVSTVWTNWTTGQSVNHPEVCSVQHWQGILANPQHRLEGSRFGCRV